MLGPVPGTRFAPAAAGRIAMALLGFHASHELYSPGDLLRHAQRAEGAGFEAVMCSDHFHPWTPAQGQSGYSFAWLGAALQATSLPLGTICCPFERYHPAVVAQAGATLSQMFPDRFWLALGTGQALNEHITGRAWPEKQERQTRLEESARVIRDLWEGKAINHRESIVVADARLYTRSAKPPLLLGAATSPETASWVASWADGLLTVTMDSATMRETVEAFRASGGEGKPMFLQAMVGYDPSEEQAWNDACHRWPIAALDQEDLQSLRTPEDFARRTAHVRPTDLRGKLRVSSQLAQHEEWLREDLTLGFNAIFLYTISGSQQRFIDAYGEHVLPAIRGSAGV